MTLRFHVLVNVAAGSIDRTPVQPAEIRGAFRGVGVDATVVTIDPEGLADAIRARAATGVDAVVVGGGDGTISAAAGVAVDGHIVLGVLPLGTFNHFARDLGMPTELPVAVATLARRG